MDDHSYGALKKAEGEFFKEYTQLREKEENDLDKMLSDCKLPPEDEQFFKEAWPRTQAKIDKALQEIRTRAQEMGMTPAAVSALERELHRRKTRPGCLTEAQQEAYFQTTLGPEENKTVYDHARACRDCLRGIFYIDIRSQKH